MHIWHRGPHHVRRNINTLVRLGIVLVLTLAGLVVAAGTPANAAAASTLAWSAPKQALLADTGNMADISCVTTSWCLAVDAKGNYLTGAKGAWTVPRRAVEGAVFTSVSCPTTGLCLATDTVGRITTYRNGSWGTPNKIFRSQFGQIPIDAIDCVDASFCVAVAHESSTVYASQWNGSAWGAPRALPLSLQRYSRAGVSCASRQLCVAATTDGFAARFDGAKWRQLDTPFHVTPDALSCARGTTVCVALADKTYRLSGTTWTVQSNAVPDYDNPTPTSLQCAAVNRCVRVGLGGLYSDVWFGFTFNGTTWTSTKIDTKYDEFRPNLTASCTTDLALCEGTGSTQEFWRPSGGKWSTTTLIDPGNYSIVSVSCTSATSCVLAGDHVVTRYDGAGWSRPKVVVQDTGETAENSNFLTDLSCASSTFCSAGAIYAGDIVYSEVYLTDGRTATRAPASGAKYVSCPSTSFCAGITFDSFGGSVSTAIYSGGSWQQPQTRLNDDPVPQVSSISCVSSTFCIAVGSDSDGGAYYRYDGSTWTLTHATMAGDQTAKVSCKTSTFCVATSTDGYASVFDGTKWSAAKRVTTTLGEVDCASTTFCVASANIGQVVEFNGTSWASPVTVSDVRVADVSCPTTKFCAAADTDGDVVFGKPKATIDS